MAAAQNAGVPVNTGVVEETKDPVLASGGTFVFAQPWFYLFSQLWRKLGGQYSTSQTMVYGLQTGSKEVTFYGVNDGVAIGKVTLT